jgi:AraC-like DNA-binding protein
VFFVGTWTSSGYCTYPSDAEILWIQFKVGVYLPLLLPSQFVNEEKVVLDGTGSTLLLNGVHYQLPNYDNVEMFVQRLVKENNLTFDPIVRAVMQNYTVAVAPRTIRHHFLTVTGQTQKHIQQFQRASQAANWLRDGKSIIDVTYDLGYADQPHLTRSLRRFFGFTPTQISRLG